jgi:tRNA-dihydrouridine synthase B
MGSGGIRAAQDAVRYLAESGADAAAIGRGCLGNPWIFREARALVQGGSEVSPPTPAERGRVLLKLVEEEFRLYGAAAAMRRMPRTSCYFAKFAPDFAAFRGGVHRVRNFTEFHRLVRDHFR